MIELKEFQKAAADQIAERFAKYYEAPPMRGRRGNLRVVPFYQGLDSITASGKTVILADAVSTICTLLPIAPVVLWLSKGKVVVDQSYTNLAAGGKYNHLLGNAAFSYLAKYDPVDVREAKEPLIYFATVGTFNQKDKEEGARLIFKSEIDTAEESTWNALKLRVDGEDDRRPLLLVYDEAPQPHRSADGPAPGAGARRADRGERHDEVADAARQRGQGAQGGGLDRRGAGHRRRRQGGRRLRAREEPDPARRLRGADGGDDRLPDRGHARRREGGRGPWRGSAQGDLRLQDEHRRGQQHADGRPQAAVPPAALTAHPDLALPHRAVRRRPGQHRRLPLA